MRARDTACRGFGIAVTALWVFGLCAAAEPYQGNKFICPMQINDNLEETHDVYAALAKHPKNTVHTVRVMGSLPCQGFLVDRPYYLRADSSDSAVLRMVLDDNEFLHLDDMFPEHTPKRVLDLGANAGLASSYFTARWPDAQIAAVEPSKLNHAMAVLNTIDSRNVRLFLGGIWDKPAKLTVRTDPRYIPGETMAEWGFLVEELTTETLARVTVDDIVPAYTVSDIMDTMGWDYIDYMKVDVECTEFQVFSNTSSIPRPWLEKVGCLSMELHEWCPDRDPLSVMITLDRAGFQFRNQFGELQIWCRPDSERGAAAAAYANKLASVLQLNSSSSSNSNSSSSGGGGGGGGSSSLAMPLSRMPPYWALTLALTAAMLVLLLRIGAPVVAKLLGMSGPCRPGLLGTALATTKHGTRLQLQQSGLETIKAAL